MVLRDSSSTQCCLFSIPLLVVIELVGLKLSSVPSPISLSIGLPKVDKVWIYTLLVCDTLAGNFIHRLHAYRYR